MTLGETFNSRCKCLLITSFIILFIGLLPALVISTTYFRKVHPWMKDSDDINFGYDGSLLCMIFSLITLVLLVLMIISLFIKCCTTNKCSECFFVFFITVSALISVGSGLVLAFQTLYNPNANISPDDQYESDDKIVHFPLCYEYFFDGVVGSGLTSALKNEKLSEYIDWVIDILFYVTEFRVEKPDKEEYKRKYNIIWSAAIKLVEFDYSARCEALRAEIITFILHYTNGVGLMNSKLCGSIGVPIILFCLIEFLGVLFFILANCCGCCCCGSKNDNNDTSIQAIQTSSLL